MAGFVFLRVRAHRLLLAAAVLAVLLTTSVLAALTAFSGAMGDAALRHTLTHRSAASASLVVSAQVTPERRASADTRAREAARATFDGLPVTVRRLEHSGPYALPRSLQPPAARRGDPDLTQFAVLDRSRVRLTSGRMPATPADADGPVQVAVPGTAAEMLKLRPGARLDLTDRLTGKPLRAVVTGLYEAADLTDPYWQLDALGGRGVRKLVFTTYGPLLTDPAAFTSGRISSGEMSWLATADFRTVTTGRIDALRDAATTGPEAVLAAPEFRSGGLARTSLPTVLDQAERALLVSRSTLTIVAVQLVLLAGYTLLLVARLLSGERGGESELLRARGGSRARIVSFAAIEALLLALPAAIAAPLLAGPLTGLLADRGSMARLGLRLDGTATGAVWAVSAAVALACALAVVAPALSSLPAGAGRRGRASALPGPVRAGADLGLLAIAAVAYWQLDRQTGGSGGGVLSGDRQGGLGIDPLLVVAPALMLLAGTVLTLRLLPPVARLAERRAAGGRGLPAALAGWQFSRRPLRGAGPVLLLVLSAAMGMLAIGQGASWDRSQADQADFRTGASIRVTGGISGDPARAGAYAALPGVRDAAPAYRTSVELSGERTAQVLALDLAHAGERMLMRGDLADGRPGALFASLTPPAPAGAARVGLPLPEGGERLELDLRISAGPAPGRAPASGAEPLVTVLLEDRYGIEYRVLPGTVPVDGAPHTLSLPVSPTGGLAVTGVELDGPLPVDTSEHHVLSVDAVRTVAADGVEKRVPVPAALRWRGTLGTIGGGEEQPDITLRPAASSAAPLTVGFDTGFVAAERTKYGIPALSVRITAARPTAPRELNAVVTDDYLRAAGAEVGQHVDVALGGETVRVKLVKAVRELPTTGPGADSSGPAGSTARSRDGGAMLLDLTAVAQVLADRPNTTLTPSEWWLSTDPGRTARVAAGLRAQPDTDPTQVLVRDEVAADLINDPLGAGPRSALLAVAVVAAALAGVGFAVSAVGSRRERTGEFAVLRALGAPRRQLARMIAAEQGVLIAVALLVGWALGSVLTRAVVPLIVLTGQAAQPVPSVLVRLPGGQVALLLAGVAALPLLCVAAIALRRAEPVVSLRQGNN
ncbi:ABC transporter permease [Streptomyces sp. AM 4-1-1]|uniref:ABC transporter permease n=1 Tax=Streptomyces sp. AM 4-1-1 TaxID=3028710 RepID=UPI0023B90C33|nr:ABC transporter permease [Streptomyces sp. AM 4-1-1]WEH33448.1 ABC transporter permease [Streptomyces sp. AM 4-1-1]